MTYPVRVGLHLARSSGVHPSSLSTSISDNELPASVAVCSCSSCRHTSASPMNAVKCRTVFPRTSRPSTSDLCIRRTIQILWWQFSVAVTRWSRSIALDTARLVLGRVTAFGQVNCLIHYVTSHPGQLNLPSLWGR